MAFSYWRTGTYPANQGGQGTQRNNVYKDYGNQFYARAKPKDKWAWNASAFRTDPVTVNLWTPNLLGASLTGWLQGDHVGGADGSAVVGWHDDIGTDAASIGSDPDLGAAILNNLNAVKFTSANTDLLTWTNVSAYTEGALFYVAKANGTGQTGLPIGRMGSNVSVERYNDGGTAGVVTSGFLSTTSKTTGAVFGDISAAHIAGFTSKASEWKIRRDGLEVYTTATNTVGGSGTTTTVGAGYGPAYFDGYIAEVVLTNSVPTLADQQKIEGYLAWKWGLVSALDAAHPYKTVPPRPPTYTLALTPGAYSITGTATGRSLPAAVGSYAITGITTTFKVAMPAAVGSYAIAGTATALIAARRLAGAVGSYAVTGISTGLKAGFKIAAAPGAYVLTGSAVTLSFHSAVVGGMTVDPGVYLLLGVPAVLGRHLRFRVSSGNYALAGTDVDFIYDSLWDAEVHPGAAAWTVTPSIAAGLFVKEPGPTQLEWSN